MVVTADPKGDFNATSQILRYSALAKEVTVPRIPSYSSTILSGHTLKNFTSASGRTTPSAFVEEMEAAQAEIARLSSEAEILVLRLTEETSRRKAAEQSWQDAEIRAAEVEEEIRDECFADMERAVEQERRRWQAAWDAEQDNNEAHMDRKIDVVIKATRQQMREQDIKVYEDPDPELRERMEELERENALLKAKLEDKERETMARTSSPVKKMRVLKTKRWVDPDDTLRAAGDDDF